MESSEEKYRKGWELAEKLNKFEILPDQFIPFVEDVKKELGDEIHYDIGFDTTYPEFYQIKKQIEKVEGQIIDTEKQGEGLDFKVRTKKQDVVSWLLGLKYKPYVLFVEFNNFEDIFVSFSPSNKHYKGGVDIHKLPPMKKLEKLQSLTLPYSQASV